MLATNVDAIVKAPAAVPNFPDNARLGLGGEVSTMALGNLNYVALSSPSQPRAAGQEVQALPAAMLPSGVGATRDASPAAGGAFEIPDSMANGIATPTGRTSASTSSPGTARAKEAVPGSAAVSVRSANGPLDVFVVDGGLNVNRQPQKDRQQAGANPAPAQ
ncbi:hypothetical protein CS062_21195 [Roseateles chitinivorans]|uniref:Uncharacterized protein n=1 Tax=Roseateles chitinivorans TaxID=2917965 RepID=A0A2G9C3Y6_9BURK|nr:hypothetical protein [Roseateles chitinivorans]PIM51151.1 hypothetical protein CS062_21195 [Roseateles chitinivorans]